MIKVLIGDMFQSKAQTWANTVNCVGVMGKGIALEFKKRFPDMFEDYAARCARSEVRLGRSDPRSPMDSAGVGGDSAAA